MKQSRAPARGYGFLWRGLESAFDAFLHAWPQDPVTKPLPKFLEIVNGHDYPSRHPFRTSNVKHLPVRQAAVVWMDTAIHTFYGSSVPPAKR